MDKSKIHQAVNTGKIQWSAHALRKMLERKITREAVKQTLLTGGFIEYYPEDQPFPSALVLGSGAGKFIHVVISYDDVRNQLYVITAYEPDDSHFHADLKTRKTDGTS